MKIPEKYYCDGCKKELDPNDKRNIIGVAIPVSTEVEWEEGHQTLPYITSTRMDLCPECYLHTTNMKCGYRGNDIKFIDGYQPDIEASKLDW